MKKFEDPAGLLGVSQIGNQIIYMAQHASTNAPTLLSIVSLSLLSGDRSTLMARIRKRSRDGYHPGVRAVRKIAQGLGCVRMRRMQSRSDPDAWKGAEDARPH